MRGTRARGAAPASPTERSSRTRPVTRSRSISCPCCWTWARSWSSSLLGVVATCSRMRCNSAVCAAIAAARRSSASVVVCARAGATRRGAARAVRGAAGRWRTLPLPPRSSSTDQSTSTLPARPRDCADAMSAKPIDSAMMLVNATTRATRTMPNRSRTPRIGSRSILRYNINGRRVLEQLNCECDAAPDGPFSRVRAPPRRRAASR